MVTQEMVKVDSQMLIRRPAEDVFQAFVDPALTTRFWFTRSSGRLAAGKTVRWHWDMYGASAAVSVQALEPAKRILIEWGEPATQVEWRFASRRDGTTLVQISTWGFQGTEQEVLAKALDAKGGFTNLLAGLKAFLERGVELNLVADHYPDAHKR